MHKYFVGKLVEEYNDRHKNKKTELMLNIDESDSISHSESAILVPVFHADHANYPLTHTKGFAEATVSHIIHSYLEIREELVRDVKGFLDYILSSLQYMTECSSWKSGLLSEDDEKKIIEISRLYWEEQHSDAPIISNERLHFTNAPMEVELKSDNMWSNNELVVIKNRIFYITPPESLYKRFYVALVTPFGENQQKVDFECSVRVLSDAIINKRPEIPYEKFSTKETTFLIHETLFFYLHQMSQILVYFINSYSWRNQTVAPFDLFELHTKIPFKF